MGIFRKWKVMSCEIKPFLQKKSCYYKKKKQVKKVEKVGRKNKTNDDSGDSQMRSATRKELKVRKKLFTCVLKRLKQILFLPLLTVVHTSTAMVGSKSQGKLSIKLLSKKKSKIVRTIFSILWRSTQIER